jgi:hypothetical protein
LPLSCAARGTVTTGGARGGLAGEVAGGAGAGAGAAGAGAGAGTGAGAGSGAGAGGATGTTGWGAVCGAGAEAAAGTACLGRATKCVTADTMWIVGACRTAAATCSAGSGRARRIVEELSWLTGRANGAGKEVSLGLPARWANAAAPARPPMSKRIAKKRWIPLMLPPRRADNITRTRYRHGRLRP